MSFKEMDTTRDTKDGRPGHSWPIELLDPAREVAAISREAVVRLRKQADDAAVVEQTWADLLKFMDLGWNAHTVSLIARYRHLLDASAKDNAAASTAIGEIGRLAEQRAAEAQKRFPRLLEDACNQADLPIDRDSPHPHYSFLAHFFSLHIDDQRRLALLSTSEGKIAQIPSDVPAVVELVCRERHRLFNRPFVSVRFLKQLRTQYLAIAKQEGTQDGASIPIRQITRRLGKNVRNFKTDEFLVDLSRLVEKGPAEIDGRHLDLQQTKDTRQGMLLPGRASRGYVGFVVFSRVI